MASHPLHHLLPEGVLQIFLLVTAVAIGGLDILPYGEETIEDLIANERGERPPLRNSNIQHQTRDFLASWLRFWWRTNLVAARVASGLVSCVAEEGGGKGGES